MLASPMLPRVPVACFPAGWFFGDGSVASSLSGLPVPQFLAGMPGMLYGPRNDALYSTMPPLMMDPIAGQYGTFPVAPPASSSASVANGTESSSPSKLSLMDALTRAVEIDAQNAADKLVLRGAVSEDSQHASTLDVNSTVIENDDSDSDYEYPQTRVKRRCAQPQQSSSGIGSRVSAFVPLQQRASNSVASLGAASPGNGWGLLPSPHDASYTGFNPYVHTISHQQLAASAPGTSSSLLSPIHSLSAGNYPSSTSMTPSSSTSSASQSTTSSTVPSPWESATSSASGSPISSSSLAASAAPSSSSSSSSTSSSSPSSSSSSPSSSSNKHWAFRHANSEWAKYDWHVRSGGRYIMTERAHRRYFACDVIGCNAVLYEDSPAEARTGEIVEGGALKMSVQRGHNHPPPAHTKPNADLLARAYALLKIMSPSQVRDTLIIEAANGIGVPSLELLQQCSSRAQRAPRPRKQRQSPPHSSPSSYSPPSPPCVHP